MKILKLSMVIGFLLIISSSCKKELELRPTDAIDITKAFTSVNDVEQGLLGVYSSNDQTNKIYIASILADETKISNENRGQGQFEFKWQFSSGPSAVNVSYRQYYTMIDRVHKVLAGMANVIPTDGAETNRMARIRGELFGLRGIANYESLINVIPPGYDPNALGIAIVKESCLLCTPPRNKAGEVIAQIETDLATAQGEPNIPTAPTDPLRLSKAAISAYQARVALLKKDWASAITFASSAITQSGKKLLSRTNFADYWRDANEGESILKYRNQNSPKLLWQDTNGDVFFEPSDKLKNSYDQINDIRYLTYFSSAGLDTSIVDKYKGSSFGATINDLKIIRLSELYLIRAEAYAETNALALAATDLNLLRATRISGYTSENFSTISNAVDAILTERLKELCFEGFRFYDLKRRALPVSRLISDVQSTSWLTLAATDYKFTLPIPQDAIDANPNTQQNPGY
ncbi:MAG: RagB/SusD family nutrient uptake outer membrane protein [Ferruginibacter sp.]